MSQLDCTQRDNVALIIILNVDVFISLRNCLTLAGIHCTLVVSENLYRVLVVAAGHKSATSLDSQRLVSQQSMTRYTVLRMKTW